MLPGTGEALNKSLQLNAQRKGPGTRMTAGTNPVHFPIPREAQSYPVGPCPKRLPDRSWQQSSPGGVGVGTINQLPGPSPSSWWLVFIIFQSVLVEL